MTLTPRKLAYVYEPGLFHPERWLLNIFQHVWEQGIKTEKNSGPESVLYQESYTVDNWSIVEKTLEYSLECTPQSHPTRA